MCLLGLLEYILTPAKVKFRFSIFVFPIGYIGSAVNGGVWWPASFFKGIFVQDDPLHFLRAYLFKMGQVEHILTMTKLKLKSFPIKTHPNCHILSKHILKYLYTYLTV